MYKGQHWFTAVKLQITIQNLKYFIRNLKVVKQNVKKMLSLVSEDKDFVECRGKTTNTTIKIHYSEQ